MDVAEVCLLLATISLSLFFIFLRTFVFISAGEAEKESMEPPGGTRDFRHSLGAADVAHFVWKYKRQGVKLQEKRLAQQRKLLISVFWCRKQSRKRTVLRK